MPSGKLTNQLDREDEKWEFLNSFPRPELKLEIFDAIPLKLNQNFTIQNTYFSSSCVNNCARVVILVSVILAILESSLFGSIVYSFYGTTGMLIASSIFFVVLLAGERYRIMWSISWWRSLRQSDAESHRAYDGTLNWTRSMTNLILFLLIPIWVAALIFVLLFGDMYVDEFPESARFLFVLVTGIDVVIFIPFCACPTAIYAACFWKRVITEEKRIQTIADERVQELEEDGF